MSYYRDMIAFGCTLWTMQVQEPPPPPPEPEESEEEEDEEQESSDDEDGEPEDAEESEGEEEEEGGEEDGEEEGEAEGEEESEESSGEEEEESDEPEGEEGGEAADEAAQTGSGEEGEGGEAETEEFDPTPAEAVEEEKPDYSEPWKARRARLPEKLGAEGLEVVALRAAEAPSNPTPRYGRVLESQTRLPGESIGQRLRWDGHSKGEAPGFLKKWQLPKEVKRLRDKIEQVLEDGLPDQRRQTLYNQLDGNLDDRYLCEIAMGEEVDRPFWTWNKIKSDVVRVAICLDACANWMSSPEEIKSRMTIAAALGSAMESLGYDVSVVAASICQDQDMRTPQKVIAAVMKAEEEPLVDSGFAHYADSGIQRLVACWVMDNTGWQHPLTDEQWREMCDADLYVYLYGLGSSGGPDGEDSLRIRSMKMADVDSAVGKLAAFFVGQVR